MIHEVTLKKEKGNTASSIKLFAGVVGTLALLIAYEYTRTLIGRPFSDDEYFLAYKAGSFLGTILHVMVLYVFPIQLAYSAFRKLTSFAGVRLAPRSALNKVD